MKRFALPYLRRTLEWSVAVSLGAAVTWMLVARPDEAGRRAPQECSSNPKMDGPAATGAKVSIHTASAPLSRAAVREHEEELARAEEAEARRHTRELLGHLESNAKVFERHAPQDTAEGIVNRLAEYMRGVTDTLQSGTPELLAAFSEHIESRFCGAEKSSSNAVQTMYMRMISQLPELGSPKTFDCFFEAHKSEDAVLWQAMDALSAAELPPPASLAQLAKQSKDPRTLRRAMSPEEQRATVEGAHVDYATLTPSLPADPGAPEP